MTETRVEKHVLRKSSPYYAMFKSYCHLSKNLYNQALYLLRQEYFTSRKILGYPYLDKILKVNVRYPDYRNMPTAQCAQQTIKKAVSNFKAFKAALWEYHKHPEFFTGKPKPPKYLDKDGHSGLVLTNQTCKYRDGSIYFPKCFDGFTLKPVFSPEYKFQQVQARYENGQIILEVIYKVSIPEPMLLNDRIIGIDIGVNNLACVANNFGAEGFIVNGRPLKSINQYYNKRLSEMKSVLKVCNDTYASNRTRKLSVKRGAKIRNYMHKSTRYIIDWCLAHDVTRIVIGHTKGWKQNVDFGIPNKWVSERLNQNFVSIPMNQFIDMLCYKAKDKGITVDIVEESYTSGTSAVDDEEPISAFYDKSRRVSRGMFITNNKQAINADLNAAYQIIRKAVPIKWRRGWVLQPVLLSF